MPCIRRDKETVARHVEYVEVDVETVAPHGVELWVDNDPALLFAVPVFNNPVVFEKTGIEVGREPATGPGGDPLVAEHGKQQHDVVTTAAERSVAHGAFMRQFVGIEGEDVVEDRVDRATMEFSQPLLR